MKCQHPNLIQTARTDYCPDCGFEYQYGDAHAKGDAQISKEVNSGKDVDRQPERRRDGSGH